MAELKAVEGQAGEAAPALVVQGPLAAAEFSARPIEGHRLLAWLLRTGAILGGSLFALSLVLEVVLPPGYTASVVLDLLRKGGASVLLATPIVRLLAAGALLGIRGEYRYAAYALGVLALLTATVGAGLIA